MANPGMVPPGPGMVPSGSGQMHPRMQRPVSQTGLTFHIEASFIEVGHLLAWPEVRSMLHLPLQK